MRWLLLVTLFALTLVTHAYAGQVSYDDVSLEELLQPVRAGHATLAIVQLATPDHVARKYPVPGGRGKRCPAYDFMEYRGTVERVVHGRAAPVLKVGKPIAIVPANIPDLVELSQRACLEGGSKSPIWGRFPGVTPSPGARLLVVLRWNERYGWLEQITGGWLPLSELPRVEALLAPPAPAAPSPPAP